MLLFRLLLPQNTPRKKQQIEKTKTCFPGYLFPLFSLSHSFTFLLFLYLLWLFVVVGCWLLLVVVVCCCCCFVVIVVCLVKGTPTKESTTKKQQNPLFYSVSCALVFRGLWPEKGQQTKGQRIIKIFFHFPENASFCRTERLGFALLSFFAAAFFFSWLAFVAKF